MAEIPQISMSDAIAVMDEEKTELDKILELLLKPENIAHNTDLTSNEITAFSALKSIYKRHPYLTALGEYIAQNLILRVSKNRRGRAEWVKITARNQYDQFQQQPQPRPGLMNRFRRR